ncbi:DEAD/DEAH box helicase [Chiayiivirga flava]|uniref:Superfamily II DNA or RNA helicase n=1 Tax=Chiayiivirga flava TaxID=659595 RepID=A0A7W8D4D6_9GAMM|nr:DEAD/DEAH box helicase [Chiayiivirga flava]MBB5207730.1 superfamily II DNA or RNA helicase [Chiayiivirga flava]
MDSTRLQRLIAGRAWLTRFNPATLNRALDEVRADRVVALRHEHDDTHGGERLVGTLRGAANGLYRCSIAFAPDGSGVPLDTRCTCTVQHECKHAAALLMFAGETPPARWPAGEAAPRARVADAPPLSPMLGAPFLGGPGTFGVGPSTPQVEDAPALVPLWDRWLQTLPPGEDDDGAGASGRRFGLLLGGDAEGRLQAAPAWLRPGRGKHIGWVDPRPLLPAEDGPRPAPDAGWAPDDLAALAALQPTPPLDGHGPHWSVVTTAVQERALLDLLQRHAAFAERGGAPLQHGDALPLRLAWQDRPDGSQVLHAGVDGIDGARLLRGHGLWYVSGEARRFGRVEGHRRVVEHLQRAPALEPERAEDLRRRLQAGRDRPRPRIGIIPAPHARGPIRHIDTTPVPVLSLRVVEFDLPGRHPSRGRARLGCALLQFDYDGHRVPPAPAGNAPIRVLRGDEVLDIRRDTRKEQRTLTRLERDGFVDATQFAEDQGRRRHPFAADEFLLQPDQHRAPLAPEAWTSAIAELAASGIRIEYGADFPRDDVVEIEEWYADIEEAGSAWFDVSLGVDLGGERVDLLPILRRLLVDPNFPMQPGKTEKPDATWRMPIDANRSIRLPLKRLRALLEPLLEWLQADNDGLRLHRTQAETLLRVGQSAGLPWRGDAALRERIERLRRHATSIDAPPGFRATLRPYQRDGLAWLDFLAEANLGGVLADDMGLGKTVQVLAHLLREKQLGRLAEPALVIAPTSLVGNWRDEAARFAPDLRVLVVHGADRADQYERIAAHDLIITTYPLLPRDRELWTAQRFSLVILDEAQAIKNARSQAAQVVREIPARRRLAMTGTPLENHLGELWAQFDAVEPGLLGNERSFARVYRTPIEKHGDADKQQRLNRRIGALLLRRRKEDVLTDLPPKTEILRSIDLEGDQRALYESLRLAQHARVQEVVQQRGLAQAGIVVLDALLKLRQVCCDPRLVKLAGARKVDESAKLDALLELVEVLRDEDRHVLLFSQFAEMLELIARALDERGIAFLRLTGDTPAKQRTDLVREFQEGRCTLFLISLKAGGVGLNLTAADTVIHYDPWWNPAVEAQATDRAHRIGQDKPVFVYKLICAGTVEEKIVALQSRKADLATAVLEGGSTQRLRFDESDLDELFGD